jgi:DNA-binding beta-propeller fold protein YncE
MTDGANFRSLAGLAALAVFAAALWAAVACTQPAKVGATHRHFYGPTRLAAQPSTTNTVTGPLVYAINSFGGNVTVLTAESDKIISSAHRVPYQPNTVWVGLAPYDIAITPDGSEIYVTDANLAPIRLIQPPVPFAVTKLLLALREARVSVAPASIDAASFTATVPPAWTAKPEVWFTDPDGSELVTWDNVKNELSGQVALPSAPVGLLVSRDGTLAYVTGADATVRVVDTATHTVLDDSLYLGGNPDRMVESVAGDVLYVLNRDPVQLHIIDLANWTQTADLFTWEAPLNDMILTTDGKVGFITSDDGNLYYFYPDQNRACVASYYQPVFFDQDPFSNPTMTNIVVTDCLTRNEIWTIVYDQINDDWTVNGTVSGLQANLAYTGQAYISDKGQLKFLIVAGTFHESEGDTFRLQTTEQQAPIPVGLLPQGLLVTPSRHVPGLDWIFVADTGGNVVNRLLVDNSTYHKIAE